MEKYEKLSLNYHEIPTLSVSQIHWSYLYPISLGDKQTAASVTLNLICWGIVPDWTHNLQSLFMSQIYELRRAEKERLLLLQNIHVVN